MLYYTIGAHKICRNLKLASILKDAILNDQENNLPHHCITDKDVHIHVVVLHTKRSKMQIGR
jgi:hypothetical protein